MSVTSRSLAKADAVKERDIIIVSHNNGDVLKEAAQTFGVIFDTVAIEHKIDAIIPTLKKGVTSPFLCLRSPLLSITAHFMD